MMASTVSTGKEGILSPESDRAHGALDRVGVQLQAAVIKEQDQPFPVIEGVTDGLSKSGTTGDAAQLLGQPWCIASTSGRLRR